MATPDSAPALPLLKLARVKAALALLALVGVGLALWLFGGDIYRAVMQAKAWAGEQGAWAGVLFVVLFVVLSCFTVPDSLFCIAAGALFGFGGGMGVVLVGATLARIVQYGLAQRVLKARVRRYIEARPRLARIAAAVLRDQFRLQVMIRLTPLNFTLGSYLFGSLGVGFGAYMKALLGTLPLQVVMVYLGVEGAHAAELGAGSGGEFGVRDTLQVVGLVVSGVVLAVVTRMAIREVRASVEGPGNAGG